MQACEEGFDMKIAAASDEESLGGVINGSLKIKVAADNRYERYKTL